MPAEYFGVWLLTAIARSFLPVKLWQFEAALN
jgi:hypothetical protein